MGAQRPAPVGDRVNQQQHAASIVHLDPVWRDRADFIIGADISESQDGSEWEQLWARQVDEARFEICCIPFLLYDVSLGDIVEVGPHAGRNYMVRAVTNASGRFTFRVWFGNARNGGDRERIVAELSTIASEVEWSSLNLLAVDAADVEVAHRVSEFLVGYQESGDLLFENGWTAER